MVSYLSKAIFTEMANMGMGIALMATQVHQKHQSSLPLFRVVGGSAPARLLAKSADPPHLLVEVERVPPLQKEDIIYALLETVLLRRKLQQKRSRMHA